VGKRKGTSEPRTLYAGGLTIQGERERKFANAAAKTFPGMAGFAGGPGAPLDRTCRECIFFRVPEGQTLYRLTDNVMRRGECAKAVKMLQREKIPTFPAHACACKYFELRVNAPPLINPHPGEHKK
jgi:hypothetical protein